jgi:hypothetical protein
MKVQIRARITGTRDGVEWPKPGELLDVPDEEGAQLCAQGLATPVVATAERATAVEPETAAAPAPKKRRA